MLSTVRLARRYKGRYKRGLKLLEKP